MTIEELVALLKRPGCVGIRFVLGDTAPLAAEIERLIFERDTLKTINHQFASEFVSERGALMVPAPGRRPERKESGCD